MNSQCDRFESVQRVFLGAESGEFAHVLRTSSFLCYTEHRREQTYESLRETFETQTNYSGFVERQNCPDALMRDFRAACDVEMVKAFQVWSEGSQDSVIDNRGGL